MMSMEKLRKQVIQRVERTEDRLLLEELDRLLRSGTGFPAASEVGEGAHAYAHPAGRDHQAILGLLKGGLRQFPKVKKAWLFGSFARGADGADSDIDLAIEVEDPFSYFDLITVQHRLEELIDRKVDIGFMDALASDVQRRIAPDLRLIHGGHA